MPALKLSQPTLEGGPLMKRYRMVCTQTTFEEITLSMEAPDEETAERWWKEGSAGITYDIEEVRFIEMIEPGEVHEIEEVE